MPTYKFECQRCGEQRTEYMTFEEHDQKTRKNNGQVFLRSTNYPHAFAQVFNFRYLRPMPEHYSPFLDAHVTSRKHYDDLSKLQQEEMSQRMGYEVSYDEIDPTDARAAGVKGDAGFESQEEARFYDGDALDAEDAALFDS